MNILVIDAQGGGVGKQLVAAIKRELPDCALTAVGTNVAASGAMQKAGADHTATGENAVIVGARRADVIVGSIGIVIADAMYGEITPAMALAVGQSSAKRVLIPFDHCDNYVAGCAELPLGRRIQAAVELLKQIRAGDA